MATTRSTPVRSYRDLIVWQRGLDLVDHAYQLTRTFPADERFGLTSQVRRAAVSIPANIAEGHGRDHLGEYLHHLSIANGSLMEFETHVLIAGRRSYVTRDVQEEALELSREVGRLLSGLVRALKGRRRL